MTEPGARKPTKPAASDGDEVVAREKTFPPAPRGHAPKRAVRDPGLPARQGLYDPKNEKDSCGVGFIADMKNVKSHAIVEQGLAILRNLAHRGAVGADPMMGDGCGILVQIPHRFFAEECAALGIALPEPGQYGVGHLFMPRDKDGRKVVQKIVEKAIKDEGLTLLGWRDVPVDNTELGQSVKATEPVHKQIFIASPKPLRRRGRVRAAPLHRAQGDLERGLRSQGRAHQGLLPGLPVARAPSSTRAWCS